MLFAIAIAAASGCRAEAVRVAAAGDLQPGGPAVADPLVALATILPGTLRFVNLESPLTARGSESGLDAAGRPLPGATIRFAAPPDRAAWLRGRVDVVSLANNHALDHGEPGRDDTARALAPHGIAAAWPGHDAELVRGRRRITVIARDFAPATDLDALTEPVDAVRIAARSGAVLVSLHWGHTGSLLPTAAQRRLAHRLADAGASAILGHGPHTLQGLERYRHAIIAYSLGNLYFGCRCTDVTDAYALTFTLARDNTATDVRAIPLHAGLRAPVAASSDAGLAELIETLSRDLGSVATREGGVVRVR